ncbi:MAG: MBL fold metallo-hydrolase [Succinatimonas hippei]|nr:MBL fold metallo-hydrolase [Succinatimonas hippei]
MSLQISVLPVTAFMQNCRIFSKDDSKEAIVCDPGDNANEIACMLEDADLKLAGIILTHAHLDHIGGVAELSDLTGSPIYGPGADDQILIDEITKQSKGLGLKPCRPFKPRFVADGQILKIGSIPELTVISTPGHTPGGVCYYCKDEDFVLTGDTLFKLSMGRTDFPGGDQRALYISLLRLANLPDTTRVLPGHGMDSTIGYERANNPYLAEAYNLLDDNKL